MDMTRALYRRDKFRQRADKLDDWLKRQLNQSLEDQNHPLSMPFDDALIDAIRDQIEALREQQFQIEDGIKAYCATRQETTAPPVTVHLSTTADAVAAHQLLLAPYDPNYTYTRSGVAGKNCTTVAMLRLTGDQLTQLLLTWNGSANLDVNVVGDETTLFLELDDALDDRLAEKYRAFLERQQRQVD